MYQHEGKDYTAIQLLNYWITERERVRVAKERGEPKPWSSDPIFQSTYFCSVRREDDKVTRWIRQNWRPEMIGWEQYDYSIVLARMLNNIPCLEELLARGPDFCEFEAVQKLLELRAEEGLQVWGGAYLVSTHGLPMGKAAYLCQRVLPHAYEALAAPGQQRRYTSSPLLLAHHHVALMQLEGLGSFMAAQVIADLKNTEGHPLSTAEDWNDWSAPGPGSLRGLKWIYGKTSNSSYDWMIKDIAKGLNQENWLSLVAPNRTEPNMQDLQNCLCEFSKYMKAMHGQRGKRKYAGT